MAKQEIQEMINEAESNKINLLNELSSEMDGGKIEYIRFKLEMNEIELQSLTEIIKNNRK